MWKEHKQYSSKWLWNWILKAALECERDIRGTMELRKTEATTLTFYDNGGEGYIDY